MKKALCRIFAVILVICLLTSVASSVSAATPVDSYTYWHGVSSNGKAVYTKSMYDFNSLIDPIKLGVERLESISSMCTDDDGNLYILDKQSRVIVLDSEYNLVRSFKGIKKSADEADDAGSIAFDEALGIYYNKGTIYICDTKGQKIQLVNKDFVLIDTIVKPVSDLIPKEEDDFQFAPKRIVIDSNDYMYVIIDGNGAYYGALLFSPQREFLGFYGANAVEVTVASVFENISNRLFPNVEKHANQQKKFRYG